MKRLLLALAIAGCAHGAESNGLIVSPAHGWVLPLFTPAGYRSVVLRGDEVRLRRDDRIDVADVTISLFSADASNRQTSIIVSPEASYFPKLNEARGPSSVRVILYQDNTELSGEDWTYRFTNTATGRREKLSIQRHVRVVLQQTLHDFLE